MTSSRTDIELEAMLDLPATWYVRGHLLDLAPDLRLALTQALALKRQGTAIVSLAKAPHDEIVVDSEQIGRLLARLGIGG
jgi:hypothetical protein